MHEFLSLFITTDCQGFKKAINEAKFEDLIKQENIDKQDLIRKKSYFEICKLSSSTDSQTNYKYNKLAAHLDVSNIL